MLAPSAAGGSAHRCHQLQRTLSSMRHSRAPPLLVPNAELAAAGTEHWPAAAASSRDQLKDSSSCKMKRFGHQGEEQRSWGLPGGSGCG